MRLAWAFALSILGCASLARADLPARLTDRGRVMPGGSLGAYVSNNNGSGLYGYADADVWLHPYLVYFIRDRIGIGGYVGYEFDRSGYDDRATHSIGGGVTMMVELPLGPRLGLLFVGELGYQQRFITRDTYYDYEQIGGSARLGQLNVGGSVPLLIHASPSVAFGFGPTVRFMPYLTASYAGATQARPVQIGANSWLGVSF